MPGPFAVFTLAILLTGGFLGYQALLRLLQHKPILPDEDFVQEPNGSVVAEDVFFDARSRELTLKTRTIPFSQIKAVYLQGMPARRINIGVILEDETWIEISRVRNNEFNRAAVNAELIADVVARQGAGFKEAVRDQFNWREVIMGQPFIYAMR